MKTKQTIFRHPILTGLLGLLLTIQPAALTFAQSGSPTPQPAPVERHLERQAPEREPSVRADGTTAAAQNTDQQLNTVIEIPAIADTYIASERPDENFGSDSLFLGYNLQGDNYGAQRILLRFNVDSIPDNAQIRSARIRLRLSFASPADDAPMRTIVRRLASDWNELDATWNREPNWASERDSAFIDRTPGYYEWEVPDLTQGWVDGSFPNFGVEIIGDENIQQRERVFYARETDTDFYPQLLVDYEISNDTAPPTVAVDALPAYVGRTFIVRWSGSDVGEAGIDYYDVQYRVNGGEWIDWLSETESQMAEFTSGQNGQTYEFRARGVDEAGNVENFGSAQAATTVDSAPPVSVVSPLPSVINVNSFVVSWSGNDAGGSGILFYEIRYRTDNGDWQIWQTQTTANSATFQAEEDGIYQFEVRASDSSDRVEPFYQQAEASTVVDNTAPFIVPVLSFPVIYASNVTVKQ